MDILRINKLEVFGFHGVLEGEKEIGQKFILSLELTLDLKKPGKTRELSDTVHYGELCATVISFFQTQREDLIETVANNLTFLILKEYPLIKSVKVNLKKPWAPIHRHLDSVEVEIFRERTVAFIAIGSNMGEKEKNCIEAIQKLGDTRGIKCIRSSTLITTEPWGNVDQDEFLNGAIQVETVLEPEELLQEIHRIEKELHRERITKWGPRTIDLDILFYGEKQIYQEELVIPHPLMQEREFVLKPLCEIAPYLIHPVYKESIENLYKKLIKA